MIRTRALPIPRVGASRFLFSGLVVSLLPWGTHKPAAKVRGNTRAHYSGYFGETTQNMKPYDELTTAEHDAIGAFFGGH